jgi:hypothetical protein
MRVSGHTNDPTHATPAAAVTHPFAMSEMKYSEIKYSGVGPLQHRQLQHCPFEARIDWKIGQEL